MRKLWSLVEKRARKKLQVLMMPSSFDEKDIFNHYKVVLKRKLYIVKIPLKRSNEHIKIKATMTKTFTITKKVSKHGKQAVIVIPSFLQQDLKPKTIVEVKITLLKEAP